MSSDTPVNPQPKVKQPTFGNLPINTSAKAKRGNQKFFDSAEWAMQQEYLKQHKQNPDLSQKEQPTVTKQVYTSAIPSNNNDKSPIVV